MYMPPGNQVVRSSQRPINISMQNVANVYMIEGHGEWRQPRARFHVPDGIQIVIYQGAGVGLDDSHGVAIAGGQALPSRLPTLYDGNNHEYDTEPHLTGGDVRANTQGLRIYYPGHECPNYTLLANNEPGYSAFAVQPGSIVAAVGAPRSLYSIALEQNYGTQLRWAACTVLR